MYDAFARPLKRFRAVITTDLRPSTKKKSRADAQDRAPPEAAPDPDPVEEEEATEEIAREEGDEEDEEERKKSENDEADDDDEKNDDVDVRAMQIAVSKQLEIQISVIIDKRSSRFVKK